VAAGAALVLAGAAGCGKFRKAKECSVLAETVSAWMASAPAPDTSIAEKPRLATEARATARRYEDLDRKLAALAIKSEELVPSLNRYRSMAREAARSLDDVAVALESGDVERARRRRVEFDATARAEAPLVAEINAACRR